MAITMKSWLYKTRISKGMNQNQLATAVGISRSYLSQFETGKRLPHPRDAMKIAKVLGFEWTRFYEDPIRPELME